LAVSVVLPVRPAHNRPAVLGTCLKSLGEQSYPRSDFEVVLVGDGCTPNDCDLPREIRRQCSSSPRRAGHVRARNRGIAMASGELVVFLDADARADSRWLEALVAGLGGAGVAGCAGAVLDEDGVDIYRRRVHAEGYPLPIVPFGNSLFRRSVLDEVGGLDEAVPFGGEEQDLTWRILLRGHAIRHVPEAIVHHPNHVRSARAHFSYGQAIRILSRRYGHVVEMPWRAELRTLMEASGLGSREGARAAAQVRNAALLAGYLYGLLRDAVRGRPAAPPLELSPANLRPPERRLRLPVEHHGRPLRVPDTVIWWLGLEGWRLANLLDRTQHRLDGTAARIWNGIVAAWPRHRLVDDLVDSFCVPRSEVEADLDRFLTDLLAAGILEVAEA